MSNSLMQWSEPHIDSIITTPQVKNHSVTYHDGYLYCFGGYDGRRNHMTLTLYSIFRKKWIRPRPISGTAPPGRNGHTATLVGDGGRIMIIGGWLGSGPLAASDVHVLDISNGVEELRWMNAPTVRGTPPGPCNMHSADYVEGQKEIYVFRGGNGREYLNDLHALHVDTYTWRYVDTTGEVPEIRANHSSAVLNETGELFIFGGWNGDKRLNDLHILNTKTSVWTRPDVGGILPHPRAGMTLTALRDRLYLFGGSGASSKCFHDLQIFDRKEMRWLDVSIQDEFHASSGASTSLGSHLMDLDPIYELEDDEDIRRGTSTNESMYHRTIEWRHEGNAYHSVAANPNDEDITSSIILSGHGPGRRAGHTATSVHNRFIYIFGGSCGSEYLSDFFILDTDPPITPIISTHINPLSLIEKRLHYCFNEKEFSDVTFLVNNKEIYAHRIILSLVSDTFSAMFRNGFRESHNKEIKIPDVSYESFYAVLEYIYRGQLPTYNSSNAASTTSIEDKISSIVSILELADQYFLDHLKQVCEVQLSKYVNRDTIEYLGMVASKTNASQLDKICKHFERNMDFWVGSSLVNNNATNDED